MHGEVALKDIYTTTYHKQYMYIVVFPSLSLGSIYTTYDRDKQQATALGLYILNYYNTTQILPIVATNLICHLGITLASQHVMFYVYNKL